MINPVACSTCHLIFDSSKYANCPTCSSQGQRNSAGNVYSGIEDQKLTSESKPNADQSGLILEVEKLVGAQNRTTAAVRSIAVFILGTVLTGIVASIVMYLGITFSSEYSFLVFASWAVLAVGSLLTLVMSISEFVESGSSRSD